MKEFLIALALTAAVFGIGFHSLTEYRNTNQQEKINAQAEEIKALNKRLKNKDDLIEKLQEDRAVLALHLKTKQRTIVTEESLDKIISQAPSLKEASKPQESPTVNYNYRYQCERDGIVYSFAVEQCPRGYESKPYSYGAGRVAQSSSESSPPQKTNNQIVSEQDKYEATKEQLSKKCDYLTYGSIERRHCRADLKKSFFNRCYSKNETPQYLRNAYCSLADNYPIVE